MDRSITPPISHLSPVRYALQQKFYLNSKHNAKYLSIQYHPDEVATLQHAVRIARQILTQEASIRISALTLVAEWQDHYGLEQALQPVTLDELPRPELIDYVRSWTNGDNMMIIIDTKMPDSKDGGISSYEPDCLRINNRRLKAACEALRISRELGDEMTYKCHVVDIAVIIVHEAQHSMRRMMVNVGITPPRFRPHGTTPTVPVDHTESEMPRKGEAGFLYESLYFGGRVVRLKSLSEYVSFPGEIEGLVVYRADRGDHLYITHNAINGIYELPTDPAGFRLLPILPTSHNPAMPGNPLRFGRVSDTHYHSVDGDEPEDFCMLDTYERGCSVISLIRKPVLENPTVNEDP